jgi:sugar phosphate isomerase/epimerase
MVREAGFSHISLGARIEHSNYLTIAGQKIIRGMIDGHGLAICSVHTPFGKGIDISSPLRDVGEQTIKTYRTCIDAAQYLGARAVIFHPTAYQQHDRMDLRRKSIVDNVNALLDYTGKTGVRLAVENDRFEPANEVLAYSLDEITDARYGFCYDSSHDNLVAQPLALLRKYGHRLFTTHISDNRGTKDDHMLPYEGALNWDGFCSIFSCVDFNGVFLLEVEMRESAFKSPEIFLREAFARGERIMRTCRKE